MLLLLEFTAVPRTKGMGPLKIAQALCSEVDMQHLHAFFQADTLAEETRITDDAMRCL
jgi:hypothetical protein